MENNNSKNNFDLDITIIGNFFKGLDRQGPGGDEQTLLALSFIREFLQQKHKLNIADLGCGTGRATATIAKALDCHITAIDFLPQMIDGLQERIKKENLESTISPLLGSMDDLHFDEESMDIIWSEGAIYNIGFERGLKEWSKYIKQGGFEGVTECCWLSDKLPSDTKWFTDNFMEIDTIPNKLAILQHSGYEPIAQFILPNSCWIENYYIPMAKRIEEFAIEYKDNSFAEALLSNLKREIDYYNQFGSLYGYVFFIGQKV